jgi:Holliday junction resolvasome RuvABC ATP-dependent DNA helicase subunit
MKIENHEVFSDIWGQERNKRELSYTIAAHHKRHYCPNLLFEGTMGSGKTTIAEKTANALGKPYILLNCGTMRKFADFYSLIYMPEMHDKSCTIILDEIHEWPKDRITSTFLSVLAPSREGDETIVNFDGAELRFHPSRHTFMACTTDSQKMFPPLRDRFDIISLQKYKPAQLVKIISDHYKNVHFTDGVVEDMKMTLRNPRNAVKLIKKLGLALESTQVLDMGAWGDIRTTLNLKPLGLLDDELKILLALEQGGSMKLFQLTAKTDLLQAQLQFYSKHLFNHDLIKAVTGGRQITEKGKSYLKKVRELDLID